ncbi:hypothetical protein JCM6882_000370 [Rhodosporidiobolus microsporus]
MACFSDFPQELVDHIVELATPSFRLKRWDERARTLNALCLTSKALLRPARRLLYREVLVDKSSSLSALLATSSGAIKAEGHKQTWLLVISCVGRQGEWPLAEKDADLARMAVLVDRLKPTKVALRDAPISFLSVAQGVTSLLLDRCGDLEDPLVPYQRFQAVTRLAIYNCEFRIDESIFTSVSFPNLVTLALRDTIYLPLGAGNGDDTFRLLDFSEDDLPLLPQLRVASLSWTDDLVDSTPLAVLDTYLPDDAPTCALEFPSSLTVLRLVRPSSSLSKNDHTLSSVVPLLSSPSFRPRLLELHVVDFPLDSAVTSKAWSEIEAWCATNRVRLFKSNPEDVDEPLDPSFWRFPDGVNARLGINV